MSGTENTPAGWFPAPDQPGNERYWDGSQWTEAYRPAEATPPIPPAGGMPGAPSGIPPVGGIPPAGGMPGAPGGAPGWQPQGAMGYQQAGPAPDNYLVFAILTTLFCCLPFGIVSIVKSSQVNGLWAQGRGAEAQAAAASAKQWAWISFGVGIAVILVYVLLIAGTLGTSSSNGF